MIWSLSRLKDWDTGFTFFPSRNTDLGSQIPDPGSRISDLCPGTQYQQKREGENNFLPGYLFFVAINFTKLKMNPGGPKTWGIRIRIPNTGWEVTITFQELKRGAASCGDVADLVLGIVLGRTRRGVASTCICQNALQVSMGWILDQIISVAGKSTVCIQYQNFKKGLFLISISGPLF
jgi:hypothetical protein